MVKKIMKELGFGDLTIHKAMKGELMCSTPAGLREPGQNILEKWSELQEQLGKDVQCYHVLEYGLEWKGELLHFVDFLLYSPQDWKDDLEDKMFYVSTGEVMCYSWCLSDEENSEPGVIGVDMMENGALKRQW